MMQIHLSASRPGDDIALSRDPGSTQVESIPHIAIQLPLIDNQRDEAVPGVAIATEVGADDAPLNDILSNLDAGRPVAADDQLNVLSVD